MTHASRSAPQLATPPVAPRTLARLPIPSIASIAGLHLVAAIACLVGLPNALFAHGSESGIDPGAVSLRIAGPDTSELKVDPRLLELELCGALPPTHLAGGIVVQGDGGGSGLRRFEVRVLRHAHLGAEVPVSLEPVGLALVGATPYPTSCGLWNYRLELDPGTTQPSSDIVLVEDPLSPRTGSSRGMLFVAAVLRLTAAGGGPTRSIPFPIALNLAAPWVLAPSGSKMPKGESNLLLFARGQGGDWIPEPRCVAEVSRGGGLCLESEAADAEPDGGDI